MYNPLSRVTVAFAQRRNLDITVWEELDNYVVSFAVWFNDNDDEPAFIVGTNAFGEFVLTRNLQLNVSVWQQLPINKIINETELRQVFDYVSLNNFRVADED